MLHKHTHAWSEHIISWCQLGAGGSHERVEGAWVLNRLSSPGRLDIVCFIWVYPTTRPITGVGGEGDFCLHSDRSWTLRCKKSCIHTIWFWAEAVQSCLQAKIHWKWITFTLCRPGKAYSWLSITWIDYNLYVVVDILASAGVRWVVVKQATLICWWNSFWERMTSD